MQDTSIVIDSRFRGPPKSGNGGYVAGVVGAQLPGVAEVTLKSPPPLGVPLQLKVFSQQATLRHANQEIAIARASELSLTVPAPPSYDEAIKASSSYTGFHQHNFPECFVCGPKRKEGDGLRIFPGVLPSLMAVAAPWLPSESLADKEGLIAEEFVWSALDCPGYFGLMKTEFAALLGRMTTQICERPSVDQRYIVMGWPIAEEGRKLQVGSAVFLESGNLMAKAKATWISVDPSKYNQS